MQKNLPFSNFDLELRLSDQKMKRWDQDFVTQKIEEHLEIYTDKVPSLEVNTSDLPSGMTSSASAQNLKETGRNSALKRIWVCGPPIMEETFDKMMPKVAKNFGLDYRTQVDIM